MQNFSFVCVCVCVCVWCAGREGGRRCGGGGGRIAQSQGVKCQMTCKKIGK